MAVSCIYTKTIFGKVSGPASASGSLNVHFVSTAVADSVTVTLFCHACDTVLASVTFNDVEYGDERDAYFDIARFESSGHPGPYEFTPNGAAGEAYVEVGTYIAQGEGETSGGGIYKTTIGGTVYYSVSATPKPGWKFDHWRSTSGLESTNNPWSLGVRNVTAPMMFNYFAFFTKLPTVTVNVVFLNKWHKHGIIQLENYSSISGVTDIVSLDDDGSFTFTLTGSSNYGNYLNLKIKEKYDSSYPSRGVMMSVPAYDYGYKPVEGEDRWLTLLSDENRLVTTIPPGYAGGPVTIYIDWHCGALLCNPPSLICKNNPNGLVYCGDNHA